MKTTFLLLCSLTLAAPAAAQDPPTLSIRPFVMLVAESFTATETFDAVFEKHNQSLFGGGVQLVLWDKFVAEVGASRVRMDGERAFHSGSESFRLGIPLKATITPVEVTGGYRFGLWEHARPYVAAGIASYGYQETSDFADAGENVDTRKIGFVLNGGFEFRLHRWIGASAEVEYTRVKGILGSSGISQQVGEDDLGGVAARVKVIVGR